MLDCELIAEHHRGLIDDFKCSDEPSVQEFLQEKALNEQISRLSVTRLYFDGNRNLVGFFTLVNETAQVSHAKKKEHGIDNLPGLVVFPAVKLKFLGVDERFRSRRYGEFMLLDAMDTALTVGVISGCVFLTLDALPDSKGFYVKYGFKLHGKNSFGNTTMAVRLDDLE